MKHADTLKPAETLYESRFFEAVHRAWEEPPTWFPLRMKRQVRVRCKSRDCPAFHFPKNGHQPGKLWIVDFLIWPSIVVELDGHEIRDDRDECLAARGLVVLHFRNEQVREMDDALSAASIVRETAKDLYMVKGLLERNKFPRSARNEIAVIAHILHDTISRSPIGLSSVLQRL